MDDDERQPTELTSIGGDVSPNNSKSTTGREGNSAVADIRELTARELAALACVRLRAIEMGDLPQPNVL